ncbi:bolA-like protein DDB_G0274169 [Lutzomyia longipalpis]|uniref:bolA-like protein DDB_G0274169 n=1 Tax=Lutzomyia longipalpis TaxID=7200 RepID=UPI002483E50B|nr:bolA-like protein DDB_G0274169 [Lutzomyia longipalpis]
MHVFGAWLGIWRGFSSRIPSTFIRCGSSMSPQGDRPVENTIRGALVSNLEPVHLEIVNESYMHNVPPSSETHFKILIVSPKFEGLTPIKRHRMVNDVVKASLNGGFVHALSLETKTPSQWDPKCKVEPSPKCLGGFGR